MRKRVTVVPMASNTNVTDPFAFDDHHVTDPFAFPDSDAETAEVPDSDDETFEDDDINNTDDEPYPFDDYVRFKAEALRLNKMSQKGQEFLALLQREQDREGGPRELPITNGVNILHDLVHFNAPMIDWGDDFVACVEKVLEIWPHAAGTICPLDKEYPLHTYFMSGRNKMFELVDEVVYALVHAYPEALTKQCLPNMETPLHIICHCEVGYDGVDEPLINYILEENPAAAAIKDSKGRYPLHSLMLTDPVETVDTARPIYEAFPEAMSTPDDNGNYPLHLALDRSRCDCDDTMGFLCDEYPQAAAIRNNDNKTPVAIRVKREGEADDTRIMMMVRDSADLNKAFSDYGLDDRLPTEDGAKLDDSIISDLAWSDEDSANTVKVNLDDEDLVQIRVIPTFTSGGSITEFASCHVVPPKTYFCHRSVLGDESRERCAMYFTIILNSSFAEASESLSSSVCIQITQRSDREERNGYGVDDDSAESDISTPKVFNADNWKEMSREENYVLHNARVRAVRDSGRERKANRDAVTTKGDTEGDVEIVSGVRSEKKWVLVALLVLFVPIFSVEFFFALSRQFMCGGDPLNQSEWAQILCSPYRGS